MARKSAGILMYRKKDNETQVFLVHMGGPHWENKDKGAWTIPKGEFDQENPLTAAIREFREETGVEPEGPYDPLDLVRQDGGKFVYAWKCEGDADPENINSNMFEMEWPPKSGETKEFPEIDKAAWFPIAEAKKKIISAQKKWLDEID